MGRYFGNIDGSKGLAGAPGFEPGMPIPKTGALPLGDAPIRKREIALSHVACKF